MEITISKLKSQDIDAVDELMKRHSKTLGFLPEQALQEYLEKEGVWGAKDDNNKLVGYLLYAAYHDRFRIVQLCVAEDFQRRGIAGRLVGKLKDSAATQKRIQLSCRRDFPANEMWPKLGFVPVDEKPGRSSARHRLTLWHLTLVPDDQLSLFQAKTSDDALDVVVDAQVFFDFYESDRDGSEPSKALISDSWIGAINLWITDELFTEINRSDNPEQREKSRNRAHEFPKIEYNMRLVKHFKQLFTPFFPSNTPSQQSDIQQLAKCASSDVKVFVTRDRDILKKSKEILDLTKVQVLSPSELITKLHELSEPQSYTPEHVSGVSLTRRRLRASDITYFPFASFLNQGERQNKLREI